MFLPSDPIDEDVLKFSRGTDDHREGMFLPNNLINEGLLIYFAVKRDYLDEFLRWKLRRDGGRVPNTRVFDRI